MPGNSKNHRGRKVVAPPGVIACDLDDSVVLLNPDEGVYYSLESVAYRIWKIVQEPVSVDEIEKTILREYDVPPEVCRRDVARLLAQLKDRKLIESSP